MCTCGYKDYKVYCLQFIEQYAIVKFDDHPIVLYRKDCVCVFVPSINIAPHM